MKTYTIKKKRDGQGWEHTGYIYASNWQEAKKEFTHSIRNDLSLDDCFVYAHDEEEFNGLGLLDLHEYLGAGYYRIDSTGIDKILDNKSVSTFSDDVYTWTINKV